MPGRITCMNVDTERSGFSPTFWCLACKIRTGSLHFHRSIYTENLKAQTSITKRLNTEKCSLSEIINVNMVMLVTQLHTSWIYGDSWYDIPILFSANYNTLQNPQKYLGTKKYPLQPSQRVYVYIKSKRYMSSQCF